MSAFKDLVRQVNANKKTKASYQQVNHDEEEEEEVTSFKGLVKKVNDGTYKVKSNYSGTQVSNWFKGVQSVSNDGYSYLSKEGYQSPNQDIIKNIDGYLNQSKEIGMYLRLNKDLFEDYDGMYKSYLDSVSYLNSLRRSVNNANNIYARYETEEDYNRDAQEWKQYWDKWGHNTEAVDFYDIAAYRNYNNPTAEDLSYYDAATDNRYFADGKDQYGNDLILVPLKEGEGGLMGHKGRSRYASPVEFDGKYKVRDPLGLYLGTDVDERESAPTDAATGKRDEILSKGTNDHWEQMTKDEINMYYYLLGARGLDTAMEYLDDTTEKRNAKWGALEAQRIQNIDNGLTKAVSYGLFSLESGLDQWATGTTQFITGEALPTSGTQHANQALISDLNGLAKYAYQAGNTVGNMLPSILLSKAISGAAMANNFTIKEALKIGGRYGAVAMGLSAGGNAYGQALKEGYSEGQARTYGILVGASEACLQNLIGGIGELGGIADDALLAKASMIDNALLRLSAKFGIKIGSEIVEEELQLFLEPAFKSIIMGEDYNAQSAVDQMLETAIVTFLSTGALEGGGTIATDMSESRQLIDTGRTIMGSETGVPALLDLASEMSGASAEDIQKRLTKQSNKVSERMEAGNKSNNTARKVAKLYDTVQTAKASQNQADIVKSLTRERNGFSEKEATAIAEALVAQSNGQELTPKQARLLNSYKDDVRVQNAVKTIVANEKSTMGQRNQKVAQLGQNIAFEAAVKEFTKRQYTEKEFTPEGKFEVTTDGKALDKDGNAIDIKGVASISKEGMLLDLGDGKTINAKDVSYADKNAALIYEAVAKLGDKINAETANKLIKQYDGKNAQVFSAGIAQAYTYGFYGISKSELNGKLASDLSSAQINAAYELGKKYRPEKDMADKANAKVKKAPGEKGVYYRDKDGNATDIRSWLKENESGLKDIQKTGIEMMEKMSEMLGIRFNVFESWVENGVTYYLDKNGKKKAGDPNGFYDPDTGEIYIDLHAGVEQRGGEIIHPGTIIFTVAHEMTHFMRQFSPAEFTKIAKIVFQHGGMKGSITELVALKQAKAKAKGKYLSYDAALEEVVADGMETILKNGNVVEFMADVKKQDQRLWAKLKEWFQNLAEFLKEMVTAYSSHSAQSTEGARVAEFSQKLLNQIEQIWAKGALDAGDTYRAAQEQFSTANMQGNADGAVVHNEATEALTDDSMFHMRTEFEAMPKQVMSLSSGEGKILSIIEGLDAKEVNGLTNKSINGYTGRDVRAFAMKNSGFTQAQIQRVNAFMDNMADFMKQAGVTYKFIGLEDVEKAQLHYTYNADGSIKSIVLSAMVKNGDYPVNFDLSSICKKREAMSALINKLAKRGSLDNGTVKLTPANIFAINTALKDEGYETACLGCFVESKRYNSMEWAKTFCNKWNAAVKKVNPNATYFGYGDATFNEDSFTLEQAVKVDEAATKYIKATKTERLANALKKYQAKEQAGQPLVESFSKAAKDRLVKSDTISEELKTKYLTCDPKSLNMADVEFLLENGVLPGASLSNKQAITEMVKSGEAYQHLLRPSDLLTDRGISKLEALPNFHGVLYGHYGSGTPKLMQSYTPYNSEIALLPTNKNKDQSLAEYLYSIAGVRMQSFSDFQIQNLYDYLQMVGDLAARKLPAHAYTKEISFAKLLGMTGIKTNLSVMFDIDPMVDKAHAGLTKLNKLVHRGEYAKVVLEDAQGKWVYNIGDYQTQRMFAEAFPDEAKRFLQSIGFADAVKLQSTPGYSANCGIIGVGYSDIGIFAMLDDNRIRYIIPYHASSLPAEIKVATHIEIGTDYTSYQNNMKIDSIVDRNGNKVEWSVKEAYKRLGSGQAVINELNENIRKNGWVVKTKKAQTGHGTYGLYEDLQQTNDPRQTASNFMDWCAKNGTLPLFYQFASHENYYKLIYDYNVYDCVTEEYAPQQAVTNTYPTIVDGQVQPGNVTDGGFNTEYLQQTAEKQMAFMNQYNENRDAFLEDLADDIDSGTMFADRFVEDKYFARQIDKISNLKEGSYVTVGKIITGSPIERVGIPVGNLYFDVSKIRQEMFKRGDPIPPETIKGIPKVLDNPMVITEYFDKSGTPSINVYGKLYIGSSPVVIGIMIGKHRNGQSVDKIQTVHPNRHFLDEVTEDNTLYLGENKKETNAWFQALGAQEPPLGGTKYGFIRMLSQPDGNVKMSDRDNAYITALNRGDMESVQRMVNQSAKDAGYDARMFHETDADNIHIFDISRGDHGGTDYQTPYGIFTKSSAKNIGLGSKQMELFVKAHNTLRVENREDVLNKIPGFAKYYDQIQAIDKKYDAISNRLEDEEFDALQEWLEEHPDVDMDEVFPLSYIAEGKPADIDYPKYLEAHERYVQNRAEWIETYNAVAVKAKAYITDYLRSNGYDSMYFVVDGGSRGRQTDSLIVLDKNQVKSADPVTYDDDGNVIPLSERFNKEKDDIRFSDRDTESVSNRSLLANAFEGIISNPIEKKKIQEYKGRVAELDAEEKKLRELNAEIKELSFGKGPRDTKKIANLRDEAVKTANRIATLDKMLFRFESSTPLQNILKREKDIVRKREKQKATEALAAQKEKFEAKQKETIEKWRENRKTAVAKARETAEKRDARAKLQKLVLDTVKWISYPAKTDVKCPDILKKPYADFLNGIDLSSKRLADGGDATKNDLRLANAMDSLATALDKIMLSQDPSQDVDNVLDTGYLDLPADFVQKLRDMTEGIKAMMVDGEYVVNTMTAAEVKKLSQMIRTLNHAIKTMSKLYANLRFANIEALGFDTMEFIDALGEIEKTGGMKDFVQWDNALPYYAFKRFGNGGESVFEGLMDAQDKLAFLAQEIFNFREKAWTDKEAKAWSEDTHTINLPNGTELTLTTADAMSIYCLSRREQGLQHLLGGGTRVMGIQKGSKKAKDSRSLLTIEDISAINSSLTDRQKKVAEDIQEFMSTVCSDWGNEVSMKRFLTKEFNEKFYFPIESNDENLPTKDPAAQQSDLFRLLNISATKPITPGANNEVIIRNIFDVFTGHASDMARLNAFGMPLLDYMKWLNYREKTANEEGQINVRGVRKSMEKAFGNAANSYVLNLVKDVNGRPSDGGEPNILMKWMRNAKTASVGSSLRVATLQITSYPRAALVLSPKSLALGLTKIPNIKKAKQYCGIALWKSFGFYDTNISRSIEDQMKGVKDVKQKLIELSLKGAEWGDAITWGCLWNACEYEVAQTTKNKVGSEEFYQEVGKKLREVVYRTQVVDSTLTRSQLMRSKRGMAQEAAAFMSEPTLSANILMDAGLQFSMEKRRTGSAKTAWKNTGKYIGRAVVVYSIGQLAAALLEGLWDAWRDDEDEEFKKKYLDAFIENLALDLVPFNKIPIVSDVFEAALAMFDVGFYSSDKMSTTWLTQAVSAVDAWKSALSGESSTTVYNALYKTTRAISSFYGVSFSGVMREGVALWNNTAGVYDTTLKVRQYELPKGDLGNELYEAIISGNTRQAESLMAQFDDSNSMHSAVRKALRENDPRIKEAAQAQLNGDPSERVRIAKLIIADGFVQDDVVAAINAEISAMTPDAGGSEPKKKGFYTVEDFAKEIANGDQATAYAAKEDIIATAQLNGKTAEKAEESFISSAKTALKEQFLAGSISEQETINALTTFCGFNEQDAMADVQYWAFRQEYPEIFADDQWFDAYYEKVADSGISIDVYMGYRGKVSTITGEGKKERRMAVIHSLQITIAQKDALYLAEGWAESKLYEAPWH